MIGIPTVVDKTPPTTRAMWTDVLAYWEPRRLIYNGLLSIVVFVYLTQNQWLLFRWQAAAVAQFVVLIAAANLCYTSAHLIDLALQHSDFRSTWREYRGWLFACGCVLGAALTRLALPILAQGVLVFK